MIDRAIIEDEPVMRKMRMCIGACFLAEEFRRDWVVSHHPHPLHSRALPNRKFRSQNDVVSKPRRSSFDPFWAFIAPVFV